ncbi:MAG TPA: hypothetical protein VGJ07_12025 [Rugosimonospora sp.]
MACAVCLAPLNTWGEAADPTYQHPLSWDTDGHEPVPVPVADLHTVARRCDFCGDDRPLWTIVGGDVSIVGLATAGGFEHNYGTRWAACATCEYWIATGKPDKVVERAAAALHWADDHTGRAHIAKLHNTFLQGRQPGRTLITTTAWPPTTITARELPKIRDRLARLYHGPDLLPSRYGDPRSRATIADGLSRAGLYWVDETFTDLSDHAATHLPDVTINREDMPATDGLLVWHHPITSQQITAATWTTTHGGWQLITYRTTGAGLTGTILQRVRENIGWLTPINTALVTEHGTLPGTDPSAPLVATWLLIAQKVAETAPADVDPGIRRAYARANRPQPEVRVLRIRGHHHRAQDTDTSPGPATGRKLTSRVFVSGHWRNQAYGKGRALRKPIYINPFLRGPDNLPIRQATTVRVLGTARPTPTIDKGVTGHGG